MKLEKLLALGLVAAMCVTCAAGCATKGNKGGKSETDIEIGYWNSGLGTDWLDAMIEAFEEKYPEYNVYYNASASNSAVTAGFGLEDTDTTDLYLNSTSYNYEDMETLDDILTSKVNNESKTIGEKLYPAYLELEKTTDGHVYTLTYGGGVISVVYNKKLFEQAGITELPKTTDELANVCDKLFAKDIVPFCHYKVMGYWDYLSEVFFAQYDGFDYYANTFYGCAEPSKDIFTKEDGRLEALKAFEKIITPDYILQGSNSNDHVTMQTEFLKGNAAMMVNGSWLASEMAGIGSIEDFAMMKTPVVSSITDKLTTVKRESDLRKVITAIDAVTDGEKAIDEYKSGDGYAVDGLTVSAADWEYLYNARNAISANHSGESMFIPNYSNAKDGAKEFIKFFYSDEGYKIYTDTLHLPLPMNLSEGEVDTSKWNDFEKSQLDLFKNSTNLVTKYIKKQNEIFNKGGASSFAGYYYVPKFCSNNLADRQTANEAWDSIVESIDNFYENTWLANIK